MDWRTPGRVRTATVTDVLEWWPEYGAAGPLWVRSGRGWTAADTASLGLPSELAARLASWNADYTEDKLPIDGPGNTEWIGQGVGLLAEARTALAGRFDIVVTERWWDEPPAN